MQKCQPLDQLGASEKKCQPLDQLGYQRKYKPLNLSRDSNSTKSSCSTRSLGAVFVDSSFFQPLGNLLSPHPLPTHGSSISSLALPARRTNRLGLDTTHGLRISSCRGPLDTRHFRIGLPSRAAPFLPLRLRVTSPGTASLASEFGLIPPHHSSDSPPRPPQVSVQSLPTRPRQGLGRVTAALCSTRKNPGCPGNRSQNGSGRKVPGRGPPYRTSAELDTTTSRRSCKHINPGARAGTSASPSSLHHRRDVLRRSSIDLPTPPPPLFARFAFQTCFVS